jgi:hypothetical protein
MSSEVLSLKLEDGQHHVDTSQTLDESFDSSLPDTKEVAVEDKDDGCLDGPARKSEQKMDEMSHIEAMNSTNYSDDYDDEDSAALPDASKVEKDEDHADSESSDDSLSGKDALLEFQKEQMMKDFDNSVLEESIKQNAQSNLMDHPPLHPDLQSDNPEIMLADQICRNMKQEGKYLEALKFMERGLLLRRDKFGLDSEYVASHASVLANSLNSLAMQSLQSDDFSVAYDMLRKAEALTESSGIMKDNETRLKLRAVTFNNFGCYYKRRGRLHAALQYLEKAIKIETTLGSYVDSPACTHLNMCAILSQLGRHAAAYEHAQIALQILLDVFPLPAEQQSEPKSNVLAIAYHNLAVEQEFLGHLEASCRSFGRAVEAATESMGPRAPMTLSIRQSYEQALEKLKNGKARRSVPLKHPLRTNSGRNQPGKSHKIPAPQLRASSAPRGRASTKLAAAQMYAQKQNPRSSSQRPVPGGNRAGSRSTRTSQSSGTENRRLSANSHSSRVPPLKVNTIRSNGNGRKSSAAATDRSRSTRGRSQEREAWPSAAAPVNKKSAMSSLTARNPTQSGVSLPENEDAPLFQRTTKLPKLQDSLHRNPGSTHAGNGATTERERWGVATTPMHFAELLAHRAPSDAENENDGEDFDERDQQAAVALSHRPAQPIPPSSLRPKTAPHKRPNSATAQVKLSHPTSPASGSGQARTRPHSAHPLRRTSGSPSKSPGRKGKLRSTAVKSVSPPKQTQPQRIAVLRGPKPPSPKPGEKIRPSVGSFRARRHVGFQGTLPLREVEEEEVDQGVPLHRVPTVPVASSDEAVQTADWTGLLTPQQRPEVMEEAASKMQQAYHQYAEKKVQKDKEQRADRVRNQHASPARNSQAMNQMLESHRTSDSSPAAKARLLGVATKPVVDSTSPLGMEAVPAEPTVEELSWSETEEGDVTCDLQKSGHSRHSAILEGEQGDQDQLQVADAFSAMDVSASPVLPLGAEPSDVVHAEAAVPSAPQQLSETPSSPNLSVTSELEASSVGSKSLSAIYHDLLTPEPTPRQQQRPTSSNDGGREAVSRSPTPPSADADADENPLHSSRPKQATGGKEKDQDQYQLHHHHHHQSQGSEEAQKRLLERISRFGNSIHKLAEKMAESDGTGSVTASEEHFIQTSALTLPLHQLPPAASGQGEPATPRSSDRPFEGPTPRLTEFLPDLERNLDFSHLEGTAASTSAAGDAAVEGPRSETKETAVLRGKADIIPEKSVETTVTVPLLSLKLPTGDARTEAEAAIANDSELFDALTTARTMERDETSFIVTPRDKSLLQPVGTAEKSFQPSQPEGDNSSFLADQQDGVDTSMAAGLEVSARQDGSLEHSVTMEEEETLAYREKIEAERQKSDAERVARLEEESIQRQEAEAQEAAVREEAERQRSLQALAEKEALELAVAAAEAAAAAEAERQAKAAMEAEALAAQEAEQAALAAQQALWAERDAAQAAEAKAKAEAKEEEMRRVAEEAQRHEAEEAAFLAAAEVERQAIEDSRIDTEVEEEEKKGESDDWQPQEKETETATETETESATETETDKCEEKRREEEQDEQVEEETALLPVPEDSPVGDTSSGSKEVASSPTTVGEAGNDIVIEEVEEKVSDLQVLLSSRAIEDARRTMDSPSSDVIFAEAESRERLSLTVEGEDEGATAPIADNHAVEQANEDAVVKKTEAEKEEEASQPLAANSAPPLETAPEDASDLEKDMNSSSLVIGAATEGVGTTVATATAMEATVATAPKIPTLSSGSALSINVSERSDLETDMTLPTPRGVDITVEESSEEVFVTQVQETLNRASAVAKALSEAEKVIQDAERTTKMQNEKSVVQQLLHPNEKKLNSSVSTPGNHSMRTPQLSYMSPPSLAFEVSREVENSLQHADEVLERLYKQTPTVIAVPSNDNENKSSNSQEGDNVQGSEGNPAQKAPNTTLQRLMDRVEQHQSLPHNPRTLAILSTQMAFQKRRGASPIKPFVESESRESSKKISSVSNTRLEALEVARENIRLRRLQKSSEE